MTQGITTSEARLARALRRAVRRVGAPARVSVAALWHLHGGPSMSHAGRIGRRDYQEPLEVLDVLVSYDPDRRRFVFAPR